MRTKSETLESGPSNVVADSLGDSSVWELLLTPPHPDHLLLPFQVLLL